MFAVGRNNQVAQICQRAGSACPDLLEQGYSLTLLPNQGRVNWAFSLSRNGGAPEYFLKANFFNPASEFERKLRLNRLAVSRQIRSKINRDIPTAEIIKDGLSPDGSFAFVLERFIPGQEAAGVDPDSRLDVLRELGQHLASIHTVQSNGFSSALPFVEAYFTDKEIPEGQYFSSYLADIFQQANAVLCSNLGLRVISDKIRVGTYNLLYQIPELPGATRAVANHGDVHLSNILLKKQENNISGLVDWDSATFQMALWPDLVTLLPDAAKFTLLGMRTGRDSRFINNPEELQALMAGYYGRGSVSVSMIRDEIMPAAAPFYARRLLHRLEGRLNKKAAFEEGRDRAILRDIHNELQINILVATLGYLADGSWVRRFGL